MASQYPLSLSLLLLLLVVVVVVRMTLECRECYSASRALSIKTMRIEDEEEEEEEKTKTVWWSCEVEWDHTTTTADENLTWLREKSSQKKWLFMICWLWTNCLKVIVFFVVFFLDKLNNVKTSNVFKLNLVSLAASANKSTAKNVFSICFLCPVLRFFFVFFSPYRHVQLWYSGNYKICVITLNNLSNLCIYLPIRGQNSAKFGWIYRFRLFIVYRLLHCAIYSSTFLKWVHFINTLYNCKVYYHSCFS